MKTVSTSALALLTLSLCAGRLCAGDYRISGPHTHANLSVFLIHGAGHDTPHLLTLQEALAQKKVVVYETGEVNRLAIENVSGHEDVYIQSGDIVKGGQQDRTFKDDLILPPKSGKVSIESFCVEHGRWSRRGQEPVTVFSTAETVVVSSELKKAVRAKSDQRAVWRQVEETQTQLAQSVRASVAAQASPTSLTLSVENSNVLHSTASYMKALSQIADGQKDVIGYAFAINGKINSAEVYASSDLFRRLWPKLLRANAVEAVADARGKEKFVAPDIDAVRAALRDAENGTASERELNARTRLVSKESDGNLFYETRDRGAWIHRSYLSK
jgi:ARG/rhodanese/phosphatase superfamily protein